MHTPRSNRLITIGNTEINYTGKITLNLLDIRLTFLQIEINGAQYLSKIFNNTTYCEYF